MNDIHELHRGLLWKCPHMAMGFCLPNSFFVFYRIFVRLYTLVRAWKCLDSNIYRNSGSPSFHGANVWTWLENLVYLQITPINIKMIIIASPGILEEYLLI